MRFVESRTRWLRAALCAAVALVGFSAAADAASAEYTAWRKAGRGLAAMTTGFLEVPGNMVVESRRNGVAYGMTLGFVKGLGGIVVRELVGVYEFVSAPIEAPEGYRPLIYPEFPWGYFDEDGQVADARLPRTGAGL
jgi:putative exosortase-associated protein (TIGR04073 family)